MATTDITPGWGVDKVLSGYGIITEWETAQEAQVAYCQNEIGEVVHRKCYDEKTTVNVTTIAPASTALPAFDATLTVEGKSFKVLSARCIQSNKDFQKISIVLERYKNFPGGNS